MEVSEREQDKYGTDSGVFPMVLFIQEYLIDLINYDFFLY